MPKVSFLADPTSTAASLEGRKVKKTAEISCFLLSAVLKTGLKPGYNCPELSKAVLRQLLTAF